MIVVGLTGSIASGKSTVTALLRKKGIHVFDADAAVHDLYADRDFSLLVEKQFPGTTSDTGVDRQKLAAATLAHPERLQQLELLVHPQVRKLQDGFLRVRSAAGDKTVVLDIPLLFETSGNPGVDVTVFVDAPEAVRQQRAASRPGMTLQKWHAIVGRQMPDSEKRKHADLVIENHGSLQELRQAVEKLLREVERKQSYA